MPPKVRVRIPKQEEELPSALVVYGAIKLKHGKEKGVEGTIPCPVCEKGTVRYAIAGSNGHVWARCSTEGCVAFMQ